MKFCYCPKCQMIRPKNWYTKKDCERCNGECVIINVRRSVYGLIMYALDALALALIAFYLGYRDWNWEAANFVGSIPQTLYFILIFGSVFASFILAYVDIKNTTKKAEEKAPGIIKEMPTPRER